MIPSRVVCVVILLGLASCERSKRQQAEVEAAKEIERSRLELANQMTMTDEGLEVDFEALEAHNKDLLASANKVGGNLGEILKVIVDLQGPLNEAGKACEAQTPFVIEAMNWKGLAEDGDYDGRRANLEKCIEVNRKCLEVYEAFAPEVIKRAKALGMSDKEFNEFEEGFTSTQGKTRGMIQIIRGCDIEISEVGIAMLNRLEKIGDSWAWDEELDQITLEDDADVEWFQEQFAAIENAAEKQASAQEAFVRFLKTKS